MWMGGGGGGNRGGLNKFLYLQRGACLREGGLVQITVNKSQKCGWGTLLKEI